MNIEELQALVEKRRSIRGYDENRAVSDDMIRTIIDCARWAPSGGNGQPWEFVVVPPRRSLEEIIHHETYDMDKFRSDDQLVGFVKTRTLQGAYGRKGGVQGAP